MGAGPRREIEGPRAAAPRMGLVASVGTVNEPESFWANGFAYEPEGCISSDTPLDVCAPGSYPSPTRPGVPIEWEPYVLWADYGCTAISAKLSEVDSKVRHRQIAMASWQLERELWTGTLAQDKSYPNRFLADVSAVDILTETGSVDALQALACLTQYLADLNGGQQGMIHATPQVVTQWVGQNLLYRQGNQLRTIARDDIVVGGNGYTGGNPDGGEVSDGDVWAYATDLVQIRMGDIVVSGVTPAEVDRVNNLIAARAEQLAVASWQGCRHAGVRLDVTVCGIGGS